MKLFETIRYISFWIKDYLAGAPVYNNLREIRSGMGLSESDKVSAPLKVKVRNLINHATGTVPYYSNIKASSSLSDFPVTNKNMINAQRASFLSQLFVKEKKIKVTTSGSTGTPFTVYQDLHKKYRNTADMLFFSEKAGFRLGSKLYYVRLWTSYYRKNRFTKWYQNIEEVNILDVSEEEKIPQIIEDIKKRKSHAWLGYASGFDAICNYLEKHQFDAPIPNRITSAIAMSEALKPETKKMFKKYFHTELLSRYSNMENGIIAQQTKEVPDKFVLNTASYVIEILKLHENKPVNNGEPGRIVITDLFNYAMPLIRYDTGDIGVMETHECNGRSYKVLSKIYGRKLDIIHDTNGKPVSPFVSFNITHFKKIKQIQLIQEDRKRYLIKLNIENGFRQHKEIINQFKSVLGPESIIELDFVDEIPLLASGKRKATVNNYIKEEENTEQLVKTL